MNSIYGLIANEPAQDQIMAQAGARENSLSVGNGVLCSGQKNGYAMAGGDHLAWYGGIYAIAGKNASRANIDAGQLLALYQQEGLEFLFRLHGAFVIAIWNGRHLLLARDRFGHKPLYYTQTPDSFIFAHSVDQLGRERALPRKANWNALYHYLSVQSIPAPLTAYEGVYKLAAGHCLSFQPGGRPDIRPWFQAEFVPDEKLEINTAKDLLKLKLDQALAGINVNACLLSGGVDSSLVAALAARKRSLKTYSMGFSHASHDETMFARQAAQILGTRHQVLPMGNPEAAVLKLARLYQEPFADSSAMAFVELARELGGQAMLCGDGGDDLFAGYPRYLNLFQYAPGQQIPENIQARFQDEVSSLQTIMGARAPMPPVGETVYYTYWARFWGQLKLRLCSAQLQASADPLSSFLLFWQHPGRNKARHPLDAVQLFELDYYTGSTLMPKTDVTTRPYGLEVFAPLMDVEVADLAFRLPLNCRVGVWQEAMPAQAKCLLKLAALDYFSPEFVLRPKMGFGVPIEHWLRKELKSMLWDLLLSGKSRQRGLFNMTVVEHMLHEHQKRIREWHYPLWALLMLELWFVEHMD